MNDDMKLVYQHLNRPYICENAECENRATIQLQGTWWHSDPDVIGWLCQGCADELGVTVEEPE